MSGGEAVHHEKTHIMGRRGILLAGVTKTGHQEHPRLFLLALVGCGSFTLVAGRGFFFLLALLGRDFGFGDSSGGFLGGTLSIRITP